MWEKNRGGLSIIYKLIRTFYSPFGSHLFPVPATRWNRAGIETETKTTTHVTNDWHIGMAAASMSQQSKPIRSGKSLSLNLYAGTLCEKRWIYSSGSGPGWYPGSHNVRYPVRFLSTRISLGCPRPHSDEITTSRKPRLSPEFDFSEFSRFRTLRWSAHTSPTRG